MRDPGLPLPSSDCSDAAAVASVSAATRVQRLGKAHAARCRGRCDQDHRRQRDAPGVRACGAIVHATATGTRCRALRAADGAGLRAATSLSTASRCGASPRMAGGQLGAGQSRARRDQRRDQAPFQPPPHPRRRGVDVTNSVSAQSSHSSCATDGDAVAADRLRPVHDLLPRDLAQRVAAAPRAHLHLVRPRCGARRVTGTAVAGGSGGGGCSGRACSTRTRRAHARRRSRTGTRSRHHGGAGCQPRAGATTLSVALAALCAGTSTETWLRPPRSCRRTAMAYRGRFVGATSRRRRVAGEDRLRPA